MRSSWSENIHRRRAGGRRRRVADAIAELIAPVVSSTLTTVVVFAPLGLLSGVVGQFFRALSLTLSAAVLLSLVLALDADSAARALGVSAAPATHARSATARRLDDGVRADAAADARASGRWRSLIGARPRASAAAASYFLRRHRLPAARRRGRLRHRLPDARRHRARGDGPAAAEGRRRLLEDAGGRRLSQRRTGSELGLFATQPNTRRRPRPAEAARRSAAASSEEIIADLRDKLARGGARHSTSSSCSCCRTCSATSKATRRRSKSRSSATIASVLAELGDQMEDDARQGRGRRGLVGVQSGNPELTWQIDPAAAGRARADRRATCRSRSPPPGSAKSRPITCAARSHHSGSRPLSGRGALRSADASAQTAVRGVDGPDCPDLGACRPWCRRTGRRVLTRENLRQMALVTGRLEGRDLGSAVDEITAKLARHEAAGRLHVGSRRTVRVAAAGVPRAAAGLRRSRRRSCSSSSWSSSARSRRRC